MTFKTSIQTAAESELNLDLEAGDVLFVLGANGSGKSSLVHKLYSQNYGSARRISAHRQTWFQSGAITLSPDGKRQTESNISRADRNPDSRWKDDYSSQRASIAIYDLIDAENVRARGIAAAVDEEHLELAQKLSKKDAPLKVINELLKLSNIPIEISIHQNEQVRASKEGGEQYSIAELSDGERNAILIAADVLTASSNTLVLVDEPERHLHRSIVSPLLTLLFSKRPDCAFVVSTHDVTLPADNPSARVLLVRGCSFSGKIPALWDVDLLESCDDIDSSIKRDILGARRKVLFVEGSPASMDASLYALMFPHVSVVSKESCREVIRAVTGIRSTQSLSWVHATGLIDGDRRTPEEASSLRADGVFALHCFSVESIYYDVELQRRLAIRHADVTGEDPEQLAKAAIAEAIAAIEPHVQRLSERAVEREIRQHLEQRMPTRTDIAAGGRIEIVVDVNARVDQEKDRMRNLLDKNELRQLIDGYPVRETPALGAIAKRLGFQDRAQYESAIRKLLIDDVDALAYVRGSLKPLSEELDAA